MEQDWDFVTIDLCTEPQCDVPTELFRDSGSTDLDVVYSTNVNYPIMRVSMSTDNADTDAGFSANWFISQDPGCERSPCAVNEYRDVNCENCPEGSQSPADSWGLTSCVCKTGYSGPNGGTCVQCSGGTFKALAGGAACDACPAGTYSFAGAAACEDVPPHSSSPDGTGFLCDAGFYSSFVSNFNVQPLTQENWFAYAYTTGASSSDPADPPPSWMSWTLPHTFQEFEVEFANGAYVGTLELTLNGVL